MAEQTPKVYKIAIVSGLLFMVFVPMFLSDILPNVIAKLLFVCGALGAGAAAFFAWMESG